MSKKPPSNNAGVPWFKPSGAVPPCVKWSGNSASHWPRFQPTSLEGLQA